MEEEGYEGVLTQAIGIGKEVEPYYFENIVEKNDKVLLCSDGLYTVLNKENLTKDIDKGSHYLVRKASMLMVDNLPDDTTAVVIDILKANELEQLKQQNITIPEKLKKDQTVDGYILEKSLIQNERTWLCSKKTKQYVIKFAPFECVDNQTSLDLFVKEAWNTKRLKADFFPKAVIPKNRTQRYYVMQLFNGEDLNTYLEHKHLTIDDSIELANTLLKMSQFLVKYDLVHGI